MKSSIRNYLSLLIVGGVFLTVMIGGVIGNIHNGNFVALPIVFTALAIAGMAVWFSHFRVRVLLRDRTPDRIISHYRSSVRRIPHADAAAAYLSALAATFFGQFDRARTELERVKWDEKPPMYQGHRRYVLAMLALLEDTDYPQALQFADEGRKLEESDPAGGLQLIDDAIRLVASGPSDEIIPRLEKVARKQHGLMPGICAWALAVHFRRIGQAETAAEYKEYLRMSVPFSVPMRQTLPQS